MVPNPITEEIRAIRHRLANEFDNDVYRIGAELRRRQAASGRRVVRLPKRSPIRNHNEQIDARETSAQSIVNSNSSPRSP